MSGFKSVTIKAQNRVSSFVRFVARANRTKNTNGFINPYHYNINDKSCKMTDITSEKVFSNELPDGATIVKKIKQQQKRSFSNAETAQMMIDYVDNQLSVYQLADTYHCHRNTISGVLKRNGVKVTKNRMNDKVVEKAKRLYASGLTLKVVRQQLGICESTIRRSLMRVGVEIREPHRYTHEERQKGINLWRSKQKQRHCHWAQSAWWPQNNL